jgi:histidyl-tRNA synthetase
MLLTTPPSPPVPQVALLPCGEEDLLPALSLAHTLRQAGLALQVLGGPQNMGKRMQKAEKMGCTWVLLLGETERMQQTVMVKNLTQRTQEAVAQGELVGFLHKALAVGSPSVIL